MNDVAHGLAFLCVVLGLVAIGGGAWVLLVAHTHLAKHERNQCALVIMVGVILLIIGFMLY